MTWQQWVLVALFSIGAISSVAMVGQHRKPITPQSAAAIVILDALLIWMVVTL